MSITTVISYCTNDFRFLGKCIEEASCFSRQIIVPVCDHFFNGTAENRERLNATYAQFSQVQFLEFPYSQHGLYPTHNRLSPQDQKWAAHWHALARLLGVYAATSEWILFLDTDEIVEGKRFREAFESGVFDPYDAVRLACYFYALKPYYRATKVQDLSLFVRKNKVTPRCFYQPDDRYGTYWRVAGSKETGLRGLDRGPLVHHYSWVRPEAECVRKVTTWGHRLDRNWEEFVQGLFQGRELGALFSSGLFNTELEFEEVPHIYFDPLAVERPTATLLTHFPHVQRLSRQDFLRLELEWEGLL
ncbi:MAG TPA: hypothetical protein VHL30_04975 [Chlamydiales bacterium]|jgi:hypothetical protein|nr:hypothetical protein [Chlamydiales bacterium]